MIAAVECALAIQEATEKAGADAPEQKRIRYRIGVNLGEVVVEGDDIYGEGVNVAARLQTLAPIGGVAISRIVKDQVDGKAKCSFEDLGEHTVKNIERPVHVFAAHAANAVAAPERQKVTSTRKLSVCVLPFANMSGDAEQEYFSDGISEDIITDLSKVSALSVIARNTAFQFKGKSIDVPQVARQLNASHILEGSVRKAGGRVRITAQLIDGAAGDHIWAERYDRDLSDIFALQDEISEAIVKALKLKLVPEEKKAIEQRGTENVEAYNVYLMARNEYVAALAGDARRYHALIRLCQRATEIDRNYARAWALMAVAQMWLKSVHGETTEGGKEAAERALSLDANLAEAHSVKAGVLMEDGKWGEASKEIEIALRLDSESHEVNRAAALLHFRQHRFAEAARHFEKAAALVTTDFGATGMLISSYAALQDRSAMRRAAEMTLERVEKVLVLDRNNAAAMGHGSDALAVLGQGERAKEWMSRAVVVEPENLLMRYNFACGLANHLMEVDAAVEMVRPVLEKAGAGLVNHAKVDPDLDPIRDDPRFKAMMAAADARLATESGKAT